MRASLLGPVSAEAGRERERKSKGEEKAGLMVGRDKSEGFSMNPGVMSRIYAARQLIVRLGGLAKTP